MDEKNIKSESIECMNNFVFWWYTLLATCIPKWDKEMQSKFKACVCRGVATWLSDRRSNLLT